MRITQVFFVSIGKPEYRFVVFREAVKALSADYIKTMLHDILYALGGAHQDKSFDVIATWCDGAAEQ